MRKHNGMRPQDVPILLKIVSLGEKSWQLAELSSALNISLSEISESLNRSKLAKLLDNNKKQVNRRNLMEFLEFGVRYVFPQVPGTLARGIPTAHTHPFMKAKFISDLNYIWPHNQGSVLGLVIEPFYPKQTEGVLNDETYYKLLALVDVIRVGKVRESAYAIKELKAIILNDASH